MPQINDTDDPAVSSIPSAFSSLTRLRRGLCPVSDIQNPTIPNAAIEGALESHSLYYEQHVPARITRISDPAAREREVARLRKVVFIMGLNSSCWGWGAQVEWFCPEEEVEQKEGEEEYTCLVFDNRGVGNSGYPRGPYTTSGMAEDVICLLDYLGWKGERELNVVGISMGGMIAQELACRIPTRISSLFLAVTTPGGGRFWENLPPLKGVITLAKLMVTPKAEEKAPLVMEMLFPVPWLDKPASSTSTSSPKHLTNREIQITAFQRRFSLTTPQRFMGHISQMAAGLTHYVSRERLASIAANVPKVVVLTGDEDHLVRPSGSVRIWEGMVGGVGSGTRAPPELSEPGKEPQDKKRIELVRWRGTGHAIQAQHVVEFNRLLERCVGEGRKLVLGGFVGRDAQPGGNVD